ncbi:hypothetical protein CK203_078177 [Vitis vinifera]|uniref:Uncharacterized protein n=1 Tax=Vitis vinifera TaxID=29760 RepID=A0A438DUG8_VITVI|nr:hypothetical protein CK203_078177 [Vitis vinifera]
MDGDSWSARLSSATKRYQSALQSRSGEARQGMEEWEKLKFGNLQDFI